MLIHTRGIVLKLTSYGDTSIVVSLFTESHGVQSFLVKGAKRPKAKLPANFFQPLQLLEIVMKFKENGNLQTLMECKLAPPYLSIPYDLSKTAVVLFLNEVLFKVLRHQHPDIPLFQFMFHALSWLDSVEHMPADFHLYFMVRLTRFLGFQPQPYRTKDRFFDLKNGVFSTYPPPHPMMLEEPQVSLLAQFTTIQLDELGQLKLTRSERKELLTKILEYYRLHVDTLGEIKSQAVLEEVLA